MKEFEPLNNEEEEILAMLLKRITWPMPQKVFEALVQNVVVTAAVDLFVFNENKEIFLIYRNDEYVGWHIPGTVVRFNETVNAALKRLLLAEMPNMKIINLVSVGWHQTLKGSAQDQDPNRSHIALMYVCQVDEGSTDLKGNFFDAYHPPIDLLRYQKVQLLEVLKRIDSL